MTPQELWRKRAWFLLTWCYFLLGYYGVDWLNQGRVLAMRPFLPGETSIPFVPASIYAYLLVGPAVLLFYAMSPTWAVYWRGIRAYWLLFAIHAAFYLAYPISIDRPTLQPDGTLAVALTQWYYAIDPPRNLFPSFHVSQSLLFGLLLWKPRPPWGYIIIGMSALIALSTVLIKQHYAADVLAAIPLTILVFRLVKE